MHAISEPFPSRFLKIQYYRDANVAMKLKSLMLSMLQHDDYNFYVDRIF